MNIILSAIKRSLRDKVSILTTIFLALVLPALFSMMFSFEEKVEEVNMHILAKEKTQITELYIETIKKFDEENDKVTIDYKVDYSPNIEEESEKLEEKIGGKSLDIIIDEKNKKIDFKNSNNINIAESAIQNITEEFFNQITIYEVSAKYGNTPSILNNDIIKTTKYEAEKEANYDSYFAIIMLQMATLIGSVYAYKNTFYIKENQGIRVKSSPMKLLKLIILESTGSFIVVAAQSAIILVLSAVLYNVKLNLINAGGLIAVLLATSILAIGMGIFTTAIANKKSHGDNIVSLITLVFVLGSGRMSPHLDFDLDKWLYKINPFAWISDSMMKLVESNSYENMGAAIGITVAYAIAFIVISSFIMKKRAVK